jgi:hypothetical protein
VGRIQIEKPVLSIAYDGSGTNLEEVFANWLEGGSTQTNIATELVVTGGMITLTDVRSVKSWQVSDFDLTAGVPADETKSDRSASLRQYRR